ncbi:MAG: F0F1 ATP synthase subunit B [Pirellulales bacterium]|nr:F0F1 ATP synthase subunit B [Pirellulales bacterium]
MLWRILTIATLVFALAVIGSAVPARADNLYDLSVDQTAEDVQEDANELRQDVRSDLAPVRQDETEVHRAIVREGHEEANTDPLEWKTDLALWTGVVFVVLMLVLWKFAWGPIANGLQRREQGIAMQISEAEQANQNAQRLLAEHQKKLDAAADEVRQILEQGRLNAEQSARQIVEAARDDAKNEHRKALAEIDQATTEALSELAEKSARLATQLAGRIVKNELRPGDHAELVKQAVADFTKSSRN